VENQKVENQKVKKQKVEKWESGKPGSEKPGSQKPKSGKVEKWKSAGVKIAQTSYWHLLLPGRTSCTGPRLITKKRLAAPKRTKNLIFLLWMY
jgi:hypothetical protein